MWDRMNAKAEPRRRIRFGHVLLAFKLLGVAAYIVVEEILGLGEATFETVVKVLIVALLIGWPITNRALR